jgi:hypothetical protein
MQLLAILPVPWLTDRCAGVESPLAGDLSPPSRASGLKKVLLGLTTIEEIEQNTSFEWAQ